MGLDSWFRTAERELINREPVTEVMDELEKKIRKHLKSLELEFTKENIIKETAEDELFALFHTFKEYFNKTYSPDGFFPLDTQIAYIVKRLKENYQ